MNGRTVRRLAAVLAAAAAPFVIAGGASGANQGGSEVHLAMISPLTGPLSFVGLDNRAGVQAAVREINARGGVRGRRLRVTIFDDASNPTQGVQHMQRIAGDSRFVGVIGSGFSSVSLAAAQLVSAARIPYISMASSAAQVTPAKPYFYMTTATSRLFAYSMA
jgi:branched-chain amino acid transport system substrate-binding protein